jgi:hypothetical protein
VEQCDRPRLPSHTLAGSWPCSERTEDELSGTALTPSPSDCHSHGWKKDAPHPYEVLCACRNTSVPEAPRRCTLDACREPSDDMA